MYQICVIFNSTLGHIKYSSTAKAQCELLVSRVHVKALKTGATYINLSFLPLEFLPPVIFSSHMQIYVLIMQIMLLVDNEFLFFTGKL